MIFGNYPVMKYHSNGSPILNCAIALPCDLENSNCCWTLPCSVSQGSAVTLFRTGEPLQCCILVRQKKCSNIGTNIYHMLKGEQRNFWRNIRKLMIIILCVKHISDIDCQVTTAND